MKRLLLTAFIWALTAPLSYGQAVDGGSAEARQRIADQERSIREFGEEVEAACKVGRDMFGADERLADRDFGGSLKGKSPPDFKVGDWGTVPTILRVLNKVSHNECLVLPDYKGSEPMLIRGWDMSKVRDGAKFVLQYPVVIQRTFSYTAVSGASKTVLVLERNESKLNELVGQVREARKEAEAKAKAASDRAMQAHLKQVELQRSKREEIAGRQADPKDRAAKADNKLKLARQFEKDAAQNPREAAQLRDSARARYQEIVRDFPGTQAAADAQDLLNGNEPQERPIPPKPTLATSEPKPPSSSAKFVGRWRIIGDGGGTVSYFTLSRSFKASRLQAGARLAKAKPGTWAVVGDEAQITWKDGWKDVLLPLDGGMVKIAFAPGASWTDSPANTQKAEKAKEPDRKPKRR